MIDLKTQKQKQIEAELIAIIAKNPKIGTILYDKYSLLTILYKNYYRVEDPKWPEQAELAKAYGLKKGPLSVALTALEKETIIKRTPGSHGGQAKIISIEDKWIEYISFIIEYDSFLEPYKPQKKKKDKQNQRIIIIHPEDIKLIHAVMINWQESIPHPSIENLIPPIKSDIENNLRFQECLNNHICFEPNPYNIWNKYKIEIEKFYSEKKILNDKIRLQIKQDWPDIDFFNDERLEDIKGRFQGIFVYELYKWILNYFKNEQNINQEIEIRVIEEPVIEDNTHTSDIIKFEIILNRDYFNHHQIYRNERGKVNIDEFKKRFKSFIDRLKSEIKEHDLFKSEAIIIINQFKDLEKMYNELLLTLNRHINTNKLPLGNCKYCRPDK